MINVPALENFCSRLTIDSKEKGLTPLYPLWGSQRRALDEICRGLEEGVHFFVILKARQLGISTISLALDLYWLFTHPGLQGSLVTDTEENRDYFKAILTGYMDSLPKSLKIPVKTHNRTMLNLRNRSRLNYQVAGIKQKGQTNSTLGQGKGVNFLHGTECSSWGDHAGTVSLTSSLAETHPNRLYTFESTAKGFNDFYGMFQDAKNSVSRMAIFIGWWSNENYSVTRDSDIYRVYGQDPPTGEELMWIDLIRSMYKYEITREQLAWWRWKLEEDVKDETLMHQNYPPTEDHAFIMSGYKCFDTYKLRAAAIACQDQPVRFWRFKFGPTYDRTEVYRTSEMMAQLKVWQEPDHYGHYVVAADPAFGSSDDGDSFCIQVIRCYTDRVEQVAEYCTTEGTCYTFAWTIAALMGAYGRAILILEINGPGKAVWQEIMRMAQYPQYLGNQRSRGFADAVANMKNYLYSRPDSLGSSYNYHWLTTTDTKQWIMHQMKDIFEREVLVVRSASDGDDSLIGEMRFISQEGGTIGASQSSKHDDRVVAMAMAIEAWQKMLLPELFELGLTYNKAMSMQPKKGENVLAHTLEGYLKQFRPKDQPVQ